MILALDASTSTRDRVAPPAWKKRHRTAPPTSTRSPARHRSTLRLIRGPHAVQGTESTPCARPDGPARPARGTEIRNVTRTFPLGSSTATG